MGKKGKFIIGFDLIVVVADDVCTRTLPTLCEFVFMNQKDFRPTVVFI